MLTITALTPPESLAATTPSTSAPLRVGLVQHRWHEDQDDLYTELSEGIAAAAKLGASVVFLPELTLSRYPASSPADDNPGRQAEDLLTGPTLAFAAKAAAENQVLVHASLYERSEAEDGLGFNTAILVSPGGELLGRTRKLHIPVTAGYYEDTYFRGGPSEDAYPVHEALGAKFGLPTCWDEWFPEVARAYSLAGAQVLVYPTAIGSEPDHPDFDTQPLWQQVIVGNGIANGTFMVVPNRHGSEGLITFYGSSFISDPYGRILVQAPRDESAVLVADLDLQHREDWLALFPFLATRRPDTYSTLTAPVKTAGAN
ncbi:nitrilase-related carbon-nitrogen hydrolase [Rhodococcus erythropolis]|jgi:N-carbamoylputrescine amidase|uniref:nitrilase-related carbon-nitrogen hydrolase n=1 Tax=Rhodococcus TaxID=1827 RepID=UPI0014233CB9|nr:nitrilase-related carbon-nitrogen hydrolase [Rhodococcus sp. (in: high G+C Gram-positive bacteria)]MBJ7476788.1 hydrolase [Rhodococcus sp. (in: high G+C Gram-positive bacteria)]NHP12830.1 hydrolase [Rhodococcus sp. IC4_135]